MVPIMSINTNNICSFLLLITTFVPIPTYYGLLSSPVVYGYIGFHQVAKSSVSISYRTFRYIGISVRQKGKKSDVSKYRKGDISISCKWNAFCSISPGIPVVFFADTEWNV